MLPVGQAETQERECSGPGPEENFVDPVFEWALVAVDVFQVWFENWTCYSYYKTVIVETLLRTTAFSYDSCNPQARPFDNGTKHLVFLSLVSIIT